jgi:hypothetical protein
MSGLKMRAEDVIMCCLVRTIAHLRQRNGGMMISGGIQKTLGLRPAQATLRSIRISYEVMLD